ncbi:bacteriocin biosynthesis cyclodehydratase domain-containing protein [Motilibacter rhizosphaerae]|uniref:Bacteriocin biosynthesis cyclodehydratase domain-containing protein n=1 Tax=Motilibacter rhizosphaerae TaxID=598652 RepID=A0A4Q7NQ02_9ACTN|nr:TOMM precursor leader peptide-binding protein [Motilibacter rhizosphaerae]RZS87182.1 bacteriocin biosynthesis cyclodehydratase domain-containing protein [Motilibacter rhizosphaerae]
MGPAQARPRLPEAVVVLRRSATEVQLGVDPERAVVIGGLGPAELDLLGRLDGSVEHDELLGHPSAGPRSARLLHLLEEAGLLASSPSGGAVLRSLPLASRDRLAPDVAAWALPPSGRQRLQRRAASSVLLLGAGRAGAAVARLLAAGGVGRVEVEDDALVAPADLLPGGYRPGDEGRPRALAAADLLQREAPVPPELAARLRQVRRRAGAPPGRLARDAPDLTVLAGDAPPAPALVDRLVRRGAPHLLLGVRDGTPVVGPLVVPGATACLRCLDLHRTDRDPAWPRVAAQLHAAGPRTRAADGALLSAAAALAALRALAHLDGEDAHAPDGSGAVVTLEVPPPVGVVRERRWLPHPCCPCGADAALGPEPPPAVLPVVPAPDAGAPGVPGVRDETGSPDVRDAEPVRPSAARGAAGAA